MTYDTPSIWLNENVPLIMERMINPSDFYFLVLYEAVLEGNETNDDSKFSESEQIRAIRCVKKWLENNNRQVLLL